MFRDEIPSDTFEGSRVSEELDINIGLRQGCSLTPTLLNLFIDNTVVERVIKY